MCFGPQPLYADYVRQSNEARHMPTTKALSGMYNWENITSHRAIALVDQKETKEYHLL